MPTPTSRKAADIATFAGRRWNSRCINPKTMSVIASIANGTAIAR